MKKYILKTVVVGFLTLFSFSCADTFLKEAPPGAYNEPALTNLKGVEGLLISTYAALDGSYFQSWDNNFFNQVGGASNWVHGSIRGADAYKGTEPTDYVDINPVERHEEQPSSSLALGKWQSCFDGIAHANETLRVLKAAVAQGLIDATTAARIEGEARFLRGHFHFELLKVFGVPPFVDETVSDDIFPSIQNNVAIWDKVEADFAFGYNGTTPLPGKMPNIGRTNKWAAGSFLAKVKMYQGKFSEAKTIWDDVIANGTTANGIAYALMPKYSDNFNVTKENGNNSESVFAFEASVYDGTFANGNYENTLNQPHGSSSLTGCCGFFQPTQFLVNAHKTTAGGLPDPSFNSADMKNDFGLGSSDPFTPDNVQPLDPRLDVTVGRRGLPYMDWGTHPGNNWIRQQSNGGPYSPKKNVPAKADLGSTAGVFDWGFAGTAKNVNIMRYADILLLAAECEAELGNVAPTIAYINQVRTRAANAADFVGDATLANYVISNYTGADITSAAQAVDAVRRERMIELAMEGHRMFDMVRWDKLGSASKSPFDVVAYLTAYLTKEKNMISHLNGATMTAKYRYMPIPEYVVTQSTVNGAKNLDQSTDWGGSRTWE